MGEWISVEDRLPEPGQRVLWWLSKRQQVALTYIGDHSASRWPNPWARDKGVTHWMPLPEPPPGQRGASGE